MNHTELLATALYREEDIVARKKNPILPLIAMLIGIAVVVWSLRSPMLAERENISSALMLAGGVIILLGLIRFVIALSGNKPVYKPTGETLVRKQLFFETKDKHTLLAAFGAGDMEKIGRIPHGESSSLVLMVYATASGSCVLAQVQEFVPHEFVAVTEVARFSQQQAKSAVVAA